MSSYSVIILMFSYMIEIVRSILDIVAIVSPLLETPTRLLTVGTGVLVRVIKEGCMSSNNIANISPFI